MALEQPPVLVHVFFVKAKRQELKYARRATRPRLPYTIVVRLYVHKIDVVTLSPELAIHVGRISMELAPSALRGLTSMWALFTCSLNLALRI